MQSRSSSSTILLILILVITAPIWLTIGGILIGVFAGVFGALFGIFGALLGGFFALIALPFKLLFGSCDLFDGGWFHLSGRGFVILCVVVLIIAMSRRQRA